MNISTTDSASSIHINPNDLLKLKDLLTKHNIHFDTETGQSDQSKPLDLDSDSDDEVVPELVADADTDADVDVDVDTDAAEAELDLTSESELELELEPETAAIPELEPVVISKPAPAPALAPVASKSKALPETLVITRPASKSKDLPETLVITRPASKSKDLPETLVITRPAAKPEVIRMSNKIILNVGGQEFKLSRDLLVALSITCRALPKLDSDTYFLDRDPYYFSKVTKLVEAHSSSKLNDIIMQHINDFSQQLVSELCFYNLLGPEFHPKPKLKLKKQVQFPTSTRHTIVIGLKVKDQQFQTSSKVLSRSPFFDLKLKLNSGRTKQFNLPDVDPKIFRYVLNFLRTGELYVNNVDIIELLDAYDISYEKLEIKKINDLIVTHYQTHNPVAEQKQLTALTAYLQANNIYQVASTHNFNTITSDSKLEFGSEITFNLSGNCLGKTIDDLVLNIDIPVLKPTENYQYVNQVEYAIVEEVTAYYFDGTDATIIGKINSHANYLSTILYNNPVIVTDRRAKLLLNDTDLIEVNRIMLPLRLLADELPIGQIKQLGHAVYVVVRICPLSKIFQGAAKTIPLLNVCLLASYTNHSTVVPVGNGKTVSWMQMPLQPRQYIFEKTQQVLAPIQANNSVYDEAILPLDKFDLIKSIYFTINDSDSDSYNNSNPNVFVDALIEAELLYLSDDNSIASYGTWDSLMLNQYIPKKKLGRDLPVGVYFYTFAADPKLNNLQGALIGNGYALRLKVKRMSNTSASASASAGASASASASIRFNVVTYIPLVI